MIGKSSLKSAAFRVLATYAVACFVVLQLLDVVAEPLGLTVATVRVVMLAMIALAPLLVGAAGWRAHRERRQAPSAVDEAAEDVVFRIDRAELDTAQRQIRFAGEPAEVQPKVFDLIEYLVRARARVVSKDELFDNIWPSVVVTEASLTQSIKRARDLFRQHGFDREVIRTVARKGYQFDYPVAASDGRAQSGPGVWAGIVAPTAAATVAAAALGFLVWTSEAERPAPRVTADAERSLVVLPFANLTPDEDFGYFSDGLSETLSSILTRVRDLRVIARGSAFSFRDSNSSYGAIGETLNVAHIVEGSVQRSGDELRISARLIRASDGEQIWSQIYSRPFDDVFALQDDLSRSIVEQMSMLLSAEFDLPDAPTMAADDASRAEAYRLLLRGRELRRNASANGFARAEADFRAALEIRPDYPEALVALANVVRVRAVLGELPREPAFAESLTLLRRALSIDPRHAAAHVELGEIQHRHSWDFEAAAESYARAEEYSPGSAVVHSAYSRFLSKAGRFDDSVREAEIAFDLDPQSPQAASSLAIRHIRARNLERGREVIEALRGAYPEHADLPWLETNWHIRNGSFRDALEWVALEELDYLRLSLSAIALFRLDRVEQARESLQQLIDTDADGAAFQIGEVYAQWREPDAAFEWLERAFSHGDPGIVELYSSVNLENLYADARFAALAGRVGLPPLDPASAL